ncbi:MAG: tripartite tricarboxylate transporter TctB family protein [Clostridia bacterium]
MGAIIKKYKNLAAVVFTLVGSVVMYIVAFGIKNIMKTGVGSEFVPQLVAILMGILSILAIIQEVRKISKGEYDSTSQESTGAIIQYRFVFLTVFIIFMYIALLELVGFLIMTTVFLFISMIMFSKKEERNYIAFIIVSVAVPVTTYFFFKDAFHVLLPPGILG